MTHTPAASSVAAAFPWHNRALVRHLLLFMHADDVLRLMRSQKRCFRSILPILQRFKRSSGRLGLALWCFQQLELEFQSYYQVLDTQQIPRSRVRDARVPPRVVSFWSERGKVEGGVVTLTPSALPVAHCDGMCAQFVVDRASETKPMLTNVVQTQRRIYTMVTVKLRSNTPEDATAAATVLRQYCYIKEFGEWVAPTPVAKRLYDAGGSGSPCRYDLVTQDGSMVLELDVPAGADSLMDYYLVKKAVVNIHMSELLQHFFQQLRPPKPLPAPATSVHQPAECIISLHFRSLQGVQLHACNIPGEIITEQQQQSQQATASDSVSGSLQSATTRESPPRAMGVEHFEIVTCRALPSPRRATASTELALPTDPGYVWLRVWDSQTKQAYYHSVILHQGASTTRGIATLRTNWLPGVLEYFPTLDSRQRRCLKGQLSATSSVITGELQELAIVAQHIPAARLERYAASIQSYARIEETQR